LDRDWRYNGISIQFVNICLPIPDGIAMIHDGWIALTISCVALSLRSMNR
jgi:hypothetical protein